MIRKEKKAIREKARKSKGNYFETLIEYLKVKNGMERQAKKDGMYRQLKSLIPALAIQELKRA